MITVSIVSALFRFVSVSPTRLKSQNVIANVAELSAWKLYLSKFLSHFTKTLSHFTNFPIDLSNLLKLLQLFRHFVTFPPFHNLDSFCPLSVYAFSFSIKTVPFCPKTSQSSPQVSHSSKQWSFLHFVQILLKTESDSLLLSQFNIPQGIGILITIHINYTISTNFLMKLNIIGIKPDLYFT